MNIRTKRITNRLHLRALGPREALLLLALTLACLSSCATSDSSRMTPQERVQLIGELQDVRQTDLKDALDTELGPAAAGDYMTQAEKADKVINDLSDNSDVSKLEISDALFIPPKHLSAAQRTQLIGQLEQAKARDDEIYRDHLGGWDPILTEDCNIQGIRVDRVVNDLKTQRSVSWSEINQAIWVPDEAAW
jgi:hypothetical protein